MKRIGVFRSGGRRAVVGLSAVMVALAAGSPSALAQTGVADAQVAQGEVKVFDIPPQALSTALVLFGQQAGQQITADGALLRGVSTSGVQGSMTVEQALRQLLSGTGLTYSGTAGATISLQRGGQTGDPSAVQLDPVRVQANTPPPQAEINNLPPPYAGGEVARGGRVGVLGNRDYMDTPFSTTTYTERTIQNQQALTLLDVVAVDPTIRTVYPRSSLDDRLIIRGFQVFARDMSFAGLYGVNPEPTVGMAGIERVEVFRGPAAMLNGMTPNGAIGGTINLIPKRAPDDGIAQVTARYLSNAEFGGQIDLGRRFGPDKILGVRANIAFTGGNTPVTNQADQLLETTIGIDYRGETTRLDADFGYQRRRIDGVRLGTFLAPTVGVPPAPNAAVNYNQPWEFFVFEDAYGMLRFEHDFARDFTGYVKVGGRHSNRDSLTTIATISNAQGNFSASPIRTLAFLETISADVGARGRFTTGPVRHEAVMNVTYQKELNGFRNTVGFSPLFTNNIYAPVGVPSPIIPASALTPPAPTSETLLTSVGLVDAMSFAQDRVQIIAGVRSQRVQTSNFSPITGTTTPSTPGNDQGAVTPTVSFVVKPLSEWAIYGNYIEALEQGPIAGAGTLNAGQTFAPFVSKQFEIGTKIDLGTFGATLSAFQITRPSSFTQAGTFMVDGQQRNRGLEFLMFGEPLPGFKPLGGFTVIDPILQQTAGGLNNGKVAPGVANFQANLGFDWDTPFFKGFGLMARVLYTGQAYIDPANTQLAPPWTRVDLGARYTFERADGKPLTLRASVINVGNANYWMATSGFMSEGLPRTVMLTLTADF